MENDKFQLPSLIDVNIDKTPLSLAILDPEAYIKQHGIKQVTSHNIYESGSSRFNSKGLFSEDIFGKITDIKRYITMGYIDLKTDIFQPPIYDIIIKLKRIYENILSGKLIVKFSKSDNDFILADENDPDAGTGYAFFVENFKKIKLDPKTYSSLKKQNKIKVLIKYQDKWFCDKLIVLPAGIRDIKEEGGRISQEDINKIYLTILSLSNSFNVKSNDPIYDPIRYNIQNKVYDIFNYIKGIVKDKSGWLQSKYSARKIVLGTRNVVSAPLTGGNSPNDETYIKYDEAGVPLFETLKAFQLNIIHYLKYSFFSDIFSVDSNKAYLIDPKTDKLKYVDVSLKEIEKFTKSDQLEKLINKFRYESFRNSPIVVYGKDKNPYYYYKVYDNDDQIYIYRTNDELMSYLHTNDPKAINKDKIHYITWAEFFYIVAYRATIDKFVLITRYPAIENGSIFPAKEHLITTSPSRVVDVTFFKNVIHLPHYPIIGNPYIDTIEVHVSRLAGLGMDFDGDTASLTGLMSDESIEENENFVNSKLSLIDDQFDLIISGDSENVNYTLANLTS